MKRYFVFIQLCLWVSLSSAQDFKDISIDSEVTDVQPMTGVVFWNTNSDKTTDAVALEYSYMSYSAIVVGEDQYDWTELDELLDAIASRNHQAVLRFRFSYPGRHTTVPAYIKELPDYEETEGTSEGKTTFFPDWRHEELQDMTLKFYEAYAERYDNDPRLAFVQTGFGLWAEYHIYSGPFILGRTFPNKEFQKTFFETLDAAFEKTFWNISIDAASDTYSPFEDDPEYKDINFGLFDDSFMHAGHAGYNTNSWNFFDRERYKLSPAGGEFSYYTSYDQQNVLNPDIGAHNDLPFEIFAQNFHISYINGNDQNNYHSLERIKEASLACGYKFKLLSVKSKPDSTIIELVNLGVAPIYIDAYLAVNGIRSKESLKLLSPNEIKTFIIPTGGDDPLVTIESDEILDKQSIQYFGTVNDYTPYERPSSAENLDNSVSKAFMVYPTIIEYGYTNVEYTGNKSYVVNVLSSDGKLLESISSSDSCQINLNYLPTGLYYLLIEEENGKRYIQKIIIL